MLTIVPTIDTEGVHGQKPFQQMVLGDVDGSVNGWGVYRLADVFSRYGVSGTFFVDVFEHSLWGREPMAEMCGRLSELGQNVELHTHPAWRDDPHDFDWLRDFKRDHSYLSQDKDFMVKLSVEEQTRLLQDGIDLIVEWTGRRPVAHRSGGYSINEDTVTAMREVGLRLDSSMHWGHANSHLTWSRNAVVERDGVVELPVTLLDYAFVVPGMGAIYRKSMKTDLDTCSLEELLAYVHQARRLGVKVMNLFMHSYSLLRFDADYRSFAPEEEDLIKLDRFLAEVASMPDVEVLDCAQFLARYEDSPESFQGPDVIPEVQVNAKIARLGLQKAWNIGHETLRRFQRVGN